MSVQLIPHPSGRSRNWYVRIYVPVEVQDLVGQEEVRRSTRTANRTEALAVGASIEAKLRAEWRQLAKTKANAHAPRDKPLPLTPAAIERICASRLADWAMTDDDRVTIGIDDEDEAKSKQHSATVSDDMRSVLARGPKSPDWNHVAEMATEYAEDMGHRVAPGDPLLPQFVRAFAQAERTAQEVIATRNDGRDASFPVPDAPGEKLSVMIDAYETHRKGVVDPKTVSKSVSIWRRLIAFLGDVALDDVTSNDIYRFFHDRLHAQTDNWSQGYVDGHAKRALREFFALARTQGRAHSENPLDRLETTPKLPKKEQEKRLKPRHPFTTEQLNTLFASAWYDLENNYLRGKMTTDLAGRYWCPLISTCHGLRVREVVQLVNSDFLFVDDVLLVTFQTELTGNDEDEDDDALPERKLKNTAARRTIPVHPRLCNLGLADFVRLMQTQHPPGTPMFPSAIPEPGGKNPVWGRAYEQAFLRHVRDKLGFGSGYGNHSFRHQLEDRVRDAQVTHGAWPAGLGEFLTGRHLPRAADRSIFREQSSAIEYGDGYSPARILRFVDQIGLEGVVFPPPYAKWLAREAA
ncbi:hypothetical protein E1N52_27185 [Paraburkholderia guartelaensis]|uniref:DUF6538 domain-containing protein n=1 Tax=Paraburkholderia guartelaensis TaxID=2546446 RepID=A0A4R5LAH7_9BURK|nr:DUF6538 domain-containing protein [Paraburkholderia guartelaensis]TDG05120.1 hypothetical protein E1N52_27185 [Paraburkholderia guartelaensis]